MWGVSQVRMNPASALTTKGVNLLSPIVFASVLFGAMIPYWSVSPHYLCVDSMHFIFHEADWCSPWAGPGSPR
jgi:hypothetical protein